MAEHRGRMAFDAGQRIKAILSSLENVCRYREQRSEDFASFDVKPRATGALPFAITIAPGGINIDSAAFGMRELALEQAEFAAQVIEAVVSGRVRQVQALGASGKVLRSKTYVRDGACRPLFVFRRKAGLLSDFAARGSIRRLRYAPYA